MVGWHFYNGLDGSPYKTWKKRRPGRAVGAGQVRSLRGIRFRSLNYSHSMVAGGLPVMSYTTRLISCT